MEIWSVNFDVDTEEDDVVLKKYDVLLLYF